MTAFAGRVAYVSDPKLRDTQGNIQSDKLGVLLNKALCLLSGAASGKDTWQGLFPAHSVVGLKVNCLAGRRLSTTPQLVAAIIASLTEAGVKPDNIIVWDRSNRELKAAGFTINRRGAGPKCFGTDAVGYERRLTTSGEVGSCLSTILTRHLKVLINVGVLKDHNLAGVSAGMKNLYGMIHNPNKYHDNTCNPYVADVSNLPVVRKALKLTIIDATLAQYHNGPAYSPAFAWQPNGILLGTDPVAVDRIACDMLEKKRKAHGLAGFRKDKRWPAWLETAAGYGLGEGDIKKIRLVEHHHGA